MENIIDLDAIRKRNAKVMIGVVNPRKAEMDRDALLAEVDRLNGIIAAAPHDVWCAEGWEFGPCDCWKAENK